MYQKTFYVLLLAVEARVSRISTDVFAKYAIPAKTPEKSDTFTAAEESIIVDAILYDAKNNTSLPWCSILDLVKEMAFLLPSDHRHDTGFLLQRLSKNWIDHFIKRHSLKVSPVQFIEERTVAAVTASNMLEHIARVQAVIDWNSIQNAKHIFNTDQPGASFAKMMSQSMRKIVQKNV